MIEDLDKIDAPKPLTFDELADWGEIMRMTTEELEADLLKNGITKEDIERSRIKILRLIEDKKKEAKMFYICLNKNNK